MNNEVKSAYIHIPFCKTICSYCDFCKQFYNTKTVNLYLDALEKEIEKDYKNEPLKTIYIGGGTPSCLSIEELEKLFKILEKLKIEENAEFTIEANISDINIEKLKLWKKYGVNRLSIGVESGQEKYLLLMERKNNKKEIIEKVLLAKEYFDNINIDFMYAFPNETITELKEDLEFIKELNTPHISIYSLILEEHTKLYLKNVEALSDIEEDKMYKLIQEFLEKDGYVHYEISNFAKEGYKSRHNLVYWNNEKYYGFGLGAGGYVGNTRYLNTRSMNHYIDGNRRKEEDIITKEIDMENEMILGLRKIEGVNKKHFFNKFGLEIEQNFDIIDLVKNGLLKDDNNYLSIPKEKLYVSNSILVHFIGGSKSE